MTLENCKRLLEHYNKILDGTISTPDGHKDWSLVMKNAKEGAESMTERIARKTSPEYQEKLLKMGKILELPKAEKKAESKSGKK